MSVFTIILYLIIVPMQVFSPSNTTLMQFDPGSAEGLWGFDIHSPSEGMDGVHPTSTNNFIYENNCLTIRILDISGMRLPGEDEFYKLDTKWKGHELFYRAPGGKWQPFAYWEDETFKMKGANRIYSFKRIEATEIPEWNAGIVRDDRANFEYKD